MAADEAGQGQEGQPRTKKVIATAEGVTVEGNGASRPLVMVADDSRALRNMVEKTLLSASMDVVQAQDGEDALRLLHLQVREKRPVDLVLMDLAMPVMNGQTCLKRIREDETLCTTRVVVVSSSSDRRSIMTCAARGISGFLVKPYKTEKLLGEVTAALAREPFEAQGLGLPQREGAPGSEAASQETPCAAARRRLVGRIQEALEEHGDGCAHAPEGGCPLAGRMRQILSELESASP
jgi:CheY-like chemotaxis protein